MCSNVSCLIWCIPLKRLGNILLRSSRYAAEFLFLAESSLRLGVSSLSF